MRFHGFCLLFLKNTQLGHDVSGCHPEYYLEDYRNGAIRFLLLLKMKPESSIFFVCFLQNYTTRIRCRWLRPKTLPGILHKKRRVLLPLLEGRYYYGFMFSINHIFCLFSNRIQQDWCLSLHTELCIYCNDRVCSPLLKTPGPQHHVLCGGVNFPSKLTSLQLMLFSKSLKNDVTVTLCAPQNHIPKTYVCSLPKLPRSPLCSFSNIMPKWLWDFLFPSRVQRYWLSSDVALTKSIYRYIFLSLSLSLEDSSSFGTLLTINNAKTWPCCRQLLFCDLCRLVTSSETLNLLRNVLLSAQSARNISGYLSLSSIFWTNISNIFGFAGLTQIVELPVYVLLFPNGSNIMYTSFGRVYQTSSMDYDVFCGLWISKSSVSY